MLQDALIAIVKKLPTWGPDISKGKFCGWLFQVVKNVAIDVIDRKANTKACLSS